MKIQLPPPGGQTTIFTLYNGLRFVHTEFAGAAAYCGVAVGAGSRDDGEGFAGRAHFVEHTLFKGTPRRRSWHISNRLERVGGELNAYTTKEETVVYANVPAGYAFRALDLLADIVADSIFPEGELRKERAVVEEEIKSYLDSPEESVYDEFEGLIYAGSDMAHNILGSAQSVAALGQRECRSFLERHYTPGNMVAWCAGPLRSADALRMAERAFARLARPDCGRVRVAPPVAPPFDIQRDEEGYQAHTVMGMRAFDRNDPRRFALFLLNNYFGGPSMNSRLTQELRDKRGYVYAVDSSVALMSDCGLMQVYFGADRDRVGRCCRIVRRELEALASECLSPTALQNAKRQYVGQLLVASDNRENIAMNAAKSVLYYGEARDVRLTAAAIAEVSAEDVRSVAELLASQGFSRLTLC